MGILLMGFILGSLVAVSAGFLDIFKIGKGGEDLEGELEESKPVNVSVTLQNTPPQVIWWEEPLDGGQPYIPNADSTQDVIFVVTVYDENGASDVKDVTVNANFSINDPDFGFVTRETSNPCDYIDGQDGSYTANYSCTITMYYYDLGQDEGPNKWTIGVNVTDKSGGSGSNISEEGSLELPFFEYGNLLSLKITLPVPPTLEWTSISSGQTNTPANNNPVEIRNTGNIKITGANNKFVTFVGRNLTGISDSNNKLYLESFGIGVDNPTSPDSDCPLFMTLNGSQQDVNNAYLPRGDNTLPDNKEELYFCIQNLLPNPIPTDEYATKSVIDETTGEGPWEVGIRNM